VAGGLPVWRKAPVPAACVAQKKKTRGGLEAGPGVAQRCRGDPRALLFRKRLRRSALGTGIRVPCGGSGGPAQGDDFHSEIEKQIWGPVNGAPLSPVCGKGPRRRSTARSSPPFGRWPLPASALVEDRRRVLSCSSQPKARFGPVYLPPVWGRSGLRRAGGPCPTSRFAAHGPNNAAEGSSPVLPRRTESVTTWRASTCSARPPTTCSSKEGNGPPWNGLTMSAQRSPCARRGAGLGPGASDETPDFQGPASRTAPGAPSRARQGGRRAS